jgi:hypothetical protein
MPALLTLSDLFLDGTPLYAEDVLLSHLGAMNQEWPDLWLKAQQIAAAKLGIPLTDDEVKEFHELRLATFNAAATGALELAPILALL